TAAAWRVLMTPLRRSPSCCATLTTRRFATSQAQRPMLRPAGSPETLAILRLRLDQSTAPSGR
ncbi:hypothetical protein BC831DRAFT_447288, partial [Entophlyctis helioformis]